MGTKNFTQKLSLILGITLLLFSVVSNAQRGRGHHWGGGYGYHHGARFHSYYRPAVSLGFRSGYYRHYGSYFYRHPNFFRPYYFPHFGFRVSVLPFGYRRIFTAGYPYYYYGGVYYAPLPYRGYEVVRPPVGARVPELPGDAQAVIIDGLQYYVVDGTYYRQILTHDNRTEYEVVRTDDRLRQENVDQNSNEQDEYKEQPGDRVNKLPEGSRSVTIKGKKYYEAPDGTFYEEIISPNKIEYEVVGKPE